jgi:hypothetical protein
MRAEPLLFECIDEPLFVFPDGERISINEIENQNLEYRTPSFYRICPTEFIEYIEYADLKNFKNPYMVFNSTFECPQMSIIEYDTKTIDKLNKEGLHIFLIENILKYNGPRIQINRSNFRENLYKLENNVGLNKGQFDDPRAFQLDSINDLIYRNNLINVNVYVPEHGIKNFSNKYKFKIFYKDIDLIRHYYKIKDTNSSIKESIKYIFLNYNWRYEPFRHVTAAYLSNYKSKVSWCFKSTEKIFRNSLWFAPPDNKLITGFSSLNSKVPLWLDHRIDDSIDLDGTILDRLKLPSNNFQPYILNPNMFNDIFCSVVSESGYFEPTSYISDKTLFTIWNSTPFIIVGPPNSLRLLKQLGFKTFEKYWDESYDSETDHEKRILKIFKLIDSLAYKDVIELSNMIKDMKDILLYNKNNIKTMVEKIQSHDFRI